jgi:hypothetical protein
LFFVTKAGREEAELEVGFLIGIDPPPIFNVRDEMMRSTMRRSREVLAGMSQAEKDYVSRQVSLDDEFDPVISAMHHQGLVALPGALSLPKVLLLIDFR